MSRKKITLQRKKVDGVANQWQSNPRQDEFLKYYYDRNSETFANAYQSAIRAGYSESYARVLTANSVKNLWLKYNDKTNLTEEHIEGLIQQIAVNGFKESDQLRALELLAKLKGMLVERNATVNLNIESALQDLK